MNASAIGLFLETVLKSIIFPWSLVHDYTAVSTLFFGNTLLCKNVYYINSIISIELIIFLLQYLSLISFIYCMKGVHELIV